MVLGIAVSVLHPSRPRFWYFLVLQGRFRYFWVHMGVGKQEVSALSVPCSLLFIQRPKQMDFFLLPVDGFFPATGRQIFSIYQQTDFFHLPSAFFQCPKQMDFFLLPVDGFFLATCRQIFLTTGRWIFFIYGKKRKVEN